MPLPHPPRPNEVSASKRHFTLSGWVGVGGGGGVEKEHLFLMSLSQWARNVLVIKYVGQPVREWGGEPRPHHTHTLPAHGRKSYMGCLLICNNPAMLSVLHMYLSIMSLCKMFEFESGTGEWSAYEYNLVLHVLRKKHTGSCRTFFHTGWKMPDFLQIC